MRRRNTHINIKNRHLFWVKCWKTIFPPNGLTKQAAVAVLISNKIVFKAIWIKKYREGQYIFIKEEVHQEDILILKWSPKHKDTQL